MLHKIQTVHIPAIKRLVLELLLATLFILVCNAILHAFVMYAVNNAS